MFNKPIKYSPLTSKEELLKFSYRTDRYCENKNVFYQHKGQIAFTDEFGAIYLTPYRSEIPSILETSGLREYAINVPIFNGEKPLAYFWLEKIAVEENWAKTHEEAFAIANQKGIKPVRISQKIQVKEIDYFIDQEHELSYSALTSMWLFNNSIENIGTYIIVNDKTLIVCDEYGRTFLVKSKSVINDIVNSLIEAGYKRTAHPEYYIDPYVDPKIEGELK